MADLPSWLRESAEGVLIQLLVQPGAKRTEFAGEHGGALRLRVAAKPTDGAANEEIIRFLSKVLGIKQRAISIQMGEFSKKKLMLMEGVTQQAVLSCVTVK